MPTTGRTVKNLVAVVTGAGTGMGAATAQLLAQDGASVAVIDRDGPAAAQVAAAIVQSGGQARSWQLDVVDADGILRTIAEIAAQFGGLDIVVNNAGVAGFLAVDDPGYDALWDSILAINLTAQQRMVRACLPWLRRSSSPRIVNIASTEGLGGTALNSAYAASKAGVIGLTRALAAELGKAGITVNCICPGPIDTPMTSSISAADKATFARRRTALRRYGLPEEVAHMTLSLCLPAASYITGAIIPVDGGLMARSG